MGRSKLTKAINDLSLDEAREAIGELAHENRRLRAILDGMAKAGVGKGALIEVFVMCEGSNASMGVVVCRADVDEMAFAESFKDGIAALAKQLSDVELTGETTRLGVTAEDVPR